MSEHTHKRHQHLEEKKERGKLMSGHAHKRHQRLESKERFKICTKHVHYCKKKKNNNNNDN